MGKSVMVNDVDFTPYITPWGYKCAYRKIQGPNTATMMNGSFLDDVIAYKITISVVCMPLTEEEMETLINALYNSDEEYASVLFYDPRVKRYRSAQCTFSSTPPTERGFGGDGKVRWTGLGFTFEER